MPSRSLLFFKYLSYAALLAIIVYVTGWSTSRWPGDVELFLTAITAFCSVYWFLDKTVWGPVRDKNNAHIIAEYKTYEDVRRALRPGDTASESQQELEDELEDKLAPPLWINNTAGCFLVLLLVWSVRSFLWEPFYVPSGSMLPTLRTGDTILVNKWKDGIRIPATTIWLTGPHLERGDPIVFRYPEDPALHFIKRVIATEGDIVVYQNRMVRVNGQPLPQATVDRQELSDLKLGNESASFLFFSETPQASLSYTIQLEQTDNSRFEPTERMAATWPNACVHDGSTVTCKVPARHAFVMGDNRDNSLDSRFWGFVPYDSIKGKATRYLLNAKSIPSSKPFSEIR